jgi:hypothetical protein
MNTLANSEELALLCAATELALLRALTNEPLPSVKMSTLACSKE